MSLIEQQIAEDKAELAKREERWKAAKPLLGPIVLKLQKLEIEPRFYSDLDINFTGDKHKLAAVIRILRVAGFEIVNGRPKANQPSWYSWLHKEGSTAQIWLSFTSSVCRRVKIGTKLVEQDIFETVCGESNPNDTQPLVDAAAKPA